MQTYNSFNELYERAYASHKIQEHVLEAFFEDLETVFTPWLIDNMEVSNLYLLFHAWAQYAIKEVNNHNRQGMLLKGYVIALLTPKAAEANITAPESSEDTEVQQETAQILVFPSRRKHE